MSETQRFSDRIYESILLRLALRVEREVGKTIDEVHEQEFDGYNGLDQDLYLRGRLSVEGEQTRFGWVSLTVMAVAHEGDRGIHQAHVRFEPCLSKHLIVDRVQDLCWRVAKEASVIYKSLEEADGVSLRL